MAQERVNSKLSDMHGTILGTAQMCTQDALCAVCGYNQWYQVVRVRYDPIAKLRAPMAGFAPMFHCARCDAPITLIFMERTDGKTDLSRPPEAPEGSEGQAATEVSPEA